MTTDTVGGVWTYALDLARALEPAGVRVHLATMGEPLSRQQRADAAAHGNVVIHESRFKLEWMNDPWPDVAAAGRWLLELEQSTQPDVVHLNGYAHGALPFAAPVIVAAHSCVLSWWEAVKGEAAPASWDHYRDAVTAGLQQADAVVAPTRAMLKAIERHYGRLPHTRVIHNAREAALFRPGKKEPFILTAGRIWDEAKNVRALEAAAPHLPWPVCVAGEPRSPDGAGGDSSDAVLPLGRLSPRALSGWFARASIYALPARYEPFGLSALEAALSGCALVLGDLASLREVWGDAAIFVPPDDVPRLTSELRRLIREPDVRRRLANAAGARARRYSLANLAAGYQDLYRQVLRRRATIDAGREDETFVPAGARNASV